MCVSRQSSRRTGGSAAGHGYWPCLSIAPESSLPRLFLFCGIYAYTARQGLIPFSSLRPLPHSSTPSSNVKCPFIFRRKKKTKCRCVYAGVRTVHTLVAPRVASVLPCSLLLRLLLLLLLLPGTVTDVIVTVSVAAATPGVVVVVVARFGRRG